MNQSPIALWVALLLCTACDDPDASNTLNAQLGMIEPPAAAGSFAPNLVRGYEGTLVMSWLEPTGEEGHALRYAVYADGDWEAAKTIASGQDWFANWADFPSVVPISGSLWGAHWLQRRPAGGYAYDIYASISSDAGSTWSEPFNPHSDDTDTEHGFVSMYPSGDGIGMIWLDGRKFVNVVTDDVVASGMTLRSATFEADLGAPNEMLLDELICDCCQTDVTVTSKGPVVVYRNRTVDEIRDIYIARYLDDSWQTGYAVNDDNWEIPGCPVNGPVIQSDGDRLAVTWFAAPEQEGKVQVAWSNDAGKTFAAPIIVTDDVPIGHVGAALQTNGDLIVSWQRRVGDGGAELRLRRVSSGGVLGDELLVTEAKDVFSYSVPQIANVDDAVLLAWTREVDDKYSIHTARVPLTLIPK